MNNDSQNQAAFEKAKLLVEVLRNLGDIIYPSDTQVIAATIEEAVIDDRVRLVAKFNDLASKACSEPERQIYMTVAKVLEESPILGG